MNYTDFLTDRPVTYRDMQLEQLRQMYAGLAMQAIISNQKYYDECISISDEPNSGFTEAAEIREKYDTTDGFLYSQSIAIDAVEYADALVEQLKKKVS